MTQRNTQSLPFTNFFSRKLQADFSGGQLTSDAGSLLLREADKNLGLIDALNRVIPDPRQPDLITHPQRTLLAQRIFGLAAGYEDLNDHQHLREDPLWHVLVDHPSTDTTPALASPPTLCRLENRVTRPTLIAMTKIFIDTFIDSHDTPPEQLILDLDSTDIEIHGHQEQRAFHGYYDCHCFLPLYVYCGDQLLVAYLRAADNDPALHAQAIVKLLVDRLRQVWPNVRIVIRGDSGFCRWPLMRWCDRNDVRYLFGLARNAVLERLAEPLMPMLDEYHQRDGRSYRTYAMTHYAAGTWDRPRRVVIKAERLGGRVPKSNPRFLVTNLPGEAQELYEMGYCPRGEMENRIKEQGQLFATRTSCHDFEANQFRLLLSAAAYVLVEYLRRVGLATTEMAQAEVKTIRLRLFKVGAWVQKTVRRVVVRMSSAYAWPRLFEEVLERLRRHRPSVLKSG